MQEKCLIRLIPKVRLQIPGAGLGAYLSARQRITVGEGKQNGRHGVCSLRKGAGKERNMRLSRFFRAKGFTLVELLVVVAIIGVIAGLAIPRFMRSSSRTKQGEAQLILKQIYDMQRAYRQLHDTYYPGDGSTIVAQPGGAIGSLDVEIMSSARYSYSITATRTSFVATAGTKKATGLDDDPTLDMWSIDQTGILNCVSNDAQN
jgi:prepilin-type N-terminal cleavage/methylation domain-containing protein